jgi:hypothetical protein
MGYTTIAAIRAAIITKVEATTPLAIDAMGSAGFVHNAAGLAGSASSDVDREFCLDQFEPGEQTMFGVTTEADYQGRFRLRIGHVLGEEGDVEASRSRADSDVGQLRRVLEKVTNYPAGVTRILLEGVSQTGKTVAETKYIESTLTFTINYTLAAV